jgi:hypothetical protein
MLLLLLLPVLLFALPWALPRRWLPACGLAFFYIAVYLVIDETRAQCAGCGGVGAAMGRAFFVLACAGFFFSFIVRLAVLIFSEKGKTVPGPSVFSAGATAALAAVGLACVAVWQTVVITRYWFDDGHWVHGIVAVLAFGWVALGRFYREERGKHGLRIFSGVGAVTTVCALAWSLQVPSKVVAAAEKAAAGEPYCLLTSGRKGLRPVRDRLDLSGFVMQDGPVSARHATLAIGESRTPAWHYWSYRKGAFEPEFLGGVLRCDLQHNAARNLNWFQAKAQSQEERFWLASGQWHIPANYLGGARDHPPVMTFHAKGEDFGPLPARSQKPVFDIEMMNAQVQVTLCDLEMLHVWQAQTDANHKVEPAGMKAGLEKQSVESQGSPRKEFQYVGRDKTGRISTWLLCHEGGDICRHAFRREGMVVEFQYSRSQFAQWREMQDLAWKRFKSFAVVWPDTGPQSCKS